VAPTTITAATPGATSILLTTTATIASGTTVTVTLSGATMGDITAGLSTGVTVGPTANAASVQKDRVSAGVNSGALGGQVTAVSMNIAPADRVPLATNKPVTVSFTTATQLISSQTVVINFPSGYLSGTIGVTLATPNIFLSTTSVTATTVTLTVGSANASPSAYTVTLTGVNMPGIMPAGCAASIWVSTTTDLRSVNSVTTQAFGGTVTGVSSSVASADRVPALTSKSITVSFTTQTQLAHNQLVSIVFPAAYFSGALSVTFAGTANTFATSTTAITNGVTIAVGSAGAAPASYTVTLTGATIGGPMSSTTNGVTVSTSTDAAGTGRTDNLGGAVSGVALTIVDRVPLATGKSVTVSFTTATALTSGQLVTISFPSNFLAGTIAVTFAGAANTFAATTTAVGTTGLTIAVGSAGANAAAYTITLTGVTMPGPQAAFVSSCTTNFNVRTTTDRMGGTNTPQIGGIVSGVTFVVAATDRVPAGTGKTVTVSFTTQTALASAQLVTITFPNTYISGSIGVTFAGAANTFATTTTVSPTQLTIAVGSAGAAAGPYTITLTGAVMGSPIAASTATGVNVLTSTDRAGTTGYPALGGGVTSAVLEILQADRIVAINRRVIVSFTLATALVQNNKITVVLPSLFVTAVTTGSVTGITATAALEVSNIVLTVGAGGVASGAQRVTICGVTLGLFSTDETRGVSVMTTLDYSASCSATGTVGESSQVTGVSMTIPFANRVAGNTGQSATFAFTTSKPLPLASPSCATSVNSITISFPTNFFVNNAAPDCGGAAATISVTGLTGYTLTGTSTGPSSNTRFIFTGSAALAAGPQSVTISGLTLGPQTSGNDVGITVETSLDVVSFGAPSGPISGYQVNSVTMPACRSSTCQNFVIVFSSTAGAINPSGTLIITFTNSPVFGNPDAFMSGSALITGALVSNTLTLTVNSRGGAWNIGSTATITLTGMTVQSTGLQMNRQFVSVGGSTQAFSASYMPTGTGTTTTNSLTIARPFPGVTNTQATIMFTTTDAIAVGDVIRVFYPRGFFINPPQTVTCSGSVDQYELTVTGLGACSRLFVSFTGMLTPTLAFVDFTVSDGGSSAGAQTIVLNGVTLSATAVAATTTLSVVTTQNSCSAGAISTGAISNANPGGPGAPAPSSGVSWVPSILAVFACALMLLL